MTDLDGVGSGGWRLVPVADRPGWEEALESVPHGVAHTWGYNAALQASGAHPVHLFVAEASGGRFVCPIVERGTGRDLDVHTPLGFSGVVGHGDVGGYERSWRAFVAQREYVAGFLGLHPVLTPPGFEPRSDAVSTNDAFILDLVADPDEMLRRMSGSMRRRLRDWPAGDAEISTDAAVLSDAFIRLFAPFMTARGAGRAYDLTEESLGRLCDASGVSLYGTPPEAPRAVVMIGLSDDGADYLYGVAEPTARHHIASLLWRAARDAAAADKRWLNLGGGIAANDSLAEFKRRMGGRQVPIIALRQIYDDGRYRRLCEQAGAAPDDEYFPPYRRPTSATWSGLR